MQEKFYIQKVDSDMKVRIKLIILFNIINVYLISLFNTVNCDDLSKPFEVRKVSTETQAPYTQPSYSFGYGLNNNKQKDGSIQKEPLFVGGGYPGLGYPNYPNPGLGAIRQRNIIFNQRLSNPYCCPCYGGLGGGLGGLGGGLIGLGGYGGLGGLGAVGGIGGGLGGTSGRLIGGFGGGLGGLGGYDGFLDGYDIDPLYRRPYGAGRLLAGGAGYPFVRRIIQPAAVSVVEEDYGIGSAASRLIYPYSSYLQDGHHGKNGHSQSTNSTISPFQTRYADPYQQTHSQQMPRVDDQYSYQYSNYKKIMDKIKKPNDFQQQKTRK